MLAARQLARRVAEEMNTRVGDGVGYLTEFGEIEDKTKIVFTQDRILLNLLLNDSSLNQYEIIIIDEAHERTMNTDILLGLMK
jgi:HrpA-like RNA helicase